jgi:voltage-gated potassium channel
MSETPRTVQWRFLIALGQAFHVAWPILSAILVIQLALGLVVGFVEGWTFGDAVYFSFVTGMTIGYGDIVPRQAFTRALAVVIGFCGILLTGLVAAIAVFAMRKTLMDGNGG